MAIKIYVEAHQNKKNTNFEKSSTKKLNHCFITPFKFPEYLPANEDKQVS